MARDYIFGGQAPEGLAISTARAAGEVAATLAANARKNAPQNNPYKGAINDVVTADSSLYTSEIGTPVYADVTFEPVTYIDREGNTQTTPEMTFAAILVSVTFPRNIVKTVIQGRDGTVKEYIGEGDAQISFRGVITGANGSYPADKVEFLKKIIKAPVAIPVTCAYLQRLDIDSVVFEDRVLEQEEGGYSYQTFSLNAVQDVPQELTIL